MIQLSKIDDELSIYKIREVYLFGAGKIGEKIAAMFESLNIPIVAYIDNDSKKKGKELNGIPIYSFDEVLRIDKDIVIQISIEDEFEVERQLMESKYKDDFITNREFNQRIYDLGKYKSLVNKNQREFYYEQPGILDVLITKNHWPLWDYAFRANLLSYKDFNILCLPPKTGDWTLNATLSSQGIEYVNFWHSSHHMNSVIEDIISGSRIKIITAVRDVISQNISIFFNMCDLFWDTKEYWNHGGDLQKLFEAWITNETGRDYGFQSSEIEFIFFERFKQAERVEYIIQDFFEREFENRFGINVFDSPFDKHEGYSIMHTDKADIFIYQVEKLDIIKDKLFSFIGCKPTELINENIGNKKWYSYAYKNFISNVHLTRQYFDACMNDRIMDHFYSIDDIEEIKKKWKKNVYD